MLGAALFGVAGAFVAVPIAALMLTLFDIYARKYELLPSLAPPAGAARPTARTARATRARCAGGSAGSRVW